MILRTGNPVFVGEILLLTEDLPFFSSVISSGAIGSNEIRENFLVVLLLGSIILED